MKILPLTLKKCFISNYREDDPDYYRKLCDLIPIFYIWHWRRIYYVGRRKFLEHGDIKYFDCVAVDEFQIIWIIRFDYQYPIRSLIKIVSSV